MAQSKLLIETLKKELKAQKKTYRDVAKVLNLSEASVKRLFSERTFILERLDQVCELLGLEITDLAMKAEQATLLVEQLTQKQELELVSDFKLLLMAFFLINRWTYPEIIETYDISETEGIQLLAKLDRMEIIQLLPGNQVKLMVSNNFRWIANGSIQQFYVDKVQSEFIDSQFSDAGEFRIFLPAMLTRNSNAEVIRKLKRLVNEFNDIVSDDQGFPLEDRIGTCMLIAMRPYAGGKEFSRLRKKPTRIF
jgi:transcriptional regulator with XRE-family HTH domain